jgi:hypothetical protein
MARTIDSILAASRAAAERREQGRPIWVMTISLRGVFGNENMTFEQRRDEIVRRIRRSSWDNVLVSDLLDEWADATTAEEFDEVWDAIYDEADADRVWIATA